MTTFVRQSFINYETETIGGRSTEYEKLGNRPLLGVYLDNSLNNVFDNLNILGRQIEEIVFGGLPGITLPTNFSKVVYNNNGTIGYSKINTDFLENLSVTNEKIDSVDYQKINLSYNGYSFLVGLNNSLIRSQGTADKSILYKKETVNPEGSANTVVISAIKLSDAINDADLGSVDGKILKSSSVAPTTFVRPIGIQTADIVDGAVTRAKMQNNLSIGTNDIINGAVTREKMQDSLTVNTADIVNEAVTTEKLKVKFFICFRWYLNGSLQETEVIGNKINIGDLTSYLTSANPVYGFQAPLEVLNFNPVSDFFTFNFWNGSFQNGANDFSKNYFLLKFPTVSTVAFLTRGNFLAGEDYFLKFSVLA